MKNSTDNAATNYSDNFIKLLFSLILLSISGYVHAITLDITRAEYDGENLVVSARLSDETRRHRFTLYDITNGSEVLLQRSDSTKDTGFDFEIAFASDAVPCQIKVTVNRPSLEAALAVEDCMQDGENDSPECTITAPTNDLTITVGQSIHFSATVTDPDGDAVDQNWNFPGGNPSTSNNSSVLVSYHTPGSFVTSLNASDSNGVGCETRTRTVTVADDTSPAPVSGNYTVLAANDLGMHCADLDYQIFSILPPFNVVHTQVIKNGTASALPQLVTDDSVTAYYTATADATGSINTTGVDTFGNPKSNFWEQSTTLVPLKKISGEFVLGTTPGVYKSWGGLAYSPLYPSILVAGLLDPVVFDILGLPTDLTTLCADPVTPTGCVSILNLFEPLPLDYGIPVPDLVDLSMGELHTTQQNMPGPANTAQPFARFDRSLPFFTKFGFGHELSDRNWFSADGIPILPVDNSGNPMSYPMLRVETRDAVSGTTLASLDVVTPVASEADCQNCHVVPMDCEETTQLTGIEMNCIGAAVTQTPFDVMELADSPPGITNLEKLLNTAKINILRLHDAKYGADYTSSIDNSASICDALLDANDPDCLANQTPVQCSQCHYSPALDLTQDGPVDELQQGLKGRQQNRHITMSRAMHGHHGTLPDYDRGDGNGPQPLFPEMPGPVGRDPIVAEQVLNATCYQCHPGKRTQCLRGAMFSGGSTCQDCHGDMEQVGNDFSLRVSTANPEDFVLDGSLRVPWASSPACQSCHTGDAVNKNHPPSAVADGVVADDGIRLLRAYETQHINVPSVPDTVKVAAMYKSAQSRFAENQAQNSNGETVDVLYRLSTGHGGVMCQACHNSTHAIWPNAMINANDNVTSRQLQGHDGTLTECRVCHGIDSFSIDDFKGNLDATGQMKGPHGMHPVGDSTMWIKKHKEVGKDSNRDVCRACHGADGEGTVLSRTADARVLECKEEDWGQCNGDTLSLQKGEQVSCGMCHEQNFINKF